MTGCWLCGVAIEPMPRTVVPDGARAVSWSASVPGRPLTRDGVHLAPSADVQTVTSGCPGAPDCTAVVKPPESAVRAVLDASGPGAPGPG